MARDAQWDFGLISPAVKTTQVYSDSIKLGTIDSRSPFAKHQTGKVEGFEVVFSLDDALVAADTLIPIIQESIDDGSNWTELVRGPITISALPAGSRLRLPVPIAHGGQIRASIYPNSSGTFGAISVHAWIEAGPN